jgi:ribosomal protein S18 acetylase RimI-like enzyme
VVRRDGEPVCCATGHDHRGDFSVTFVATLPEQRGQGLAGRLLTHALHDARERGCTTTSLQATKVGEPVYRRLGYRGLGPVQMWERRATG